MNKLQWGFDFNPGACIQCLGCEAACKIWRHSENSIRWRRIANVWHGNYPHVICSAVSLSCQHCLNPACADVCPTEAISKTPDGPVLIDREKCIGCGACFDACPYDVPQFGADGLMQKCDMCAETSGIRPDGDSRPPCVATCPTGALTLIQMTADEKLESERTVLTDLKKHKEMHK